MAADDIVSIALFFAASSLSVQTNKSTVSCVFSIPIFSSCPAAQLNIPMAVDSEDTYLETTIGILS
jgi:hypothetical protein